MWPPHGFRNVTGHGYFVAERSSASADTVTAPPCLVLMPGPLSRRFSCFHLCDPTDPAPVLPSPSSSNGRVASALGRAEMLRRKWRKGRTVQGDSRDHEMTFTAVKTLLSAGYFHCTRSLTLPAAHLTFALMLRSKFKETTIW